MASLTYITKDDDQLDAICVQYYGPDSEHVTARVLASNRHLSAYPIILPAGVCITLPDITPAQNPHIEPTPW